MKRYVIAALLCGALSVGAAAHGRSLLLDEDFSDIAAGTIGGTGGEIVSEDGNQHLKIAGGSLLFSGLADFELTFRFNYAETVHRPHNAGNLLFGNGDYRYNFGGRLIAYNEPPGRWAASEWKKNAETVLAEGGPVIAKAPGWTWVRISVDGRRVQVYTSGSGDFANDSEKRIDVEVDEPPRGHIRIVSDKGYVQIDDLYLVGEMPQLQEPQQAGTHEVGALAHKLRRGAHSNRPGFEVSRPWYVEDEIRTAAAVMLAKLGRDASVALPDLVIRRYLDHQLGVRLAAERAIRSIQPDADRLQILTAALNAEERELRLLAELALAQAFPEAAKSPDRDDEKPELNLPHDLTAQSATVRASAAKAAGQQEEPAAETLKQLRQLLDDADAEVRSAAVDALGKLGAKVQVDVVGKVMNKKDDFQWVIRDRQEAAVEAVPDLEKRLSDDAPVVRASAAAALGRILAGADDTPGIVAGLLVVLQGDKEVNVRREAAIALARIGVTDKDNGKILIKALEDEQDSVVRAVTLRTLAAMALPEVRPVFEKHLSDDSMVARDAAAAGLFALGVEEKEMDTHDKKLELGMRKSREYLSPDGSPGGYAVETGQAYAFSLAAKLYADPFSPADALERTNALIRHYCRRDGRQHRYTNAAVFGIYLREQTGALLAAETRAAIEDHAWYVVTRNAQEVTLRCAELSFRQMQGSENHFMMNFRQHYAALQVLARAERYGPELILEGVPLKVQLDMWEDFWMRYFKDRATEGLDLEVNTKDSYAAMTWNGYYDMHYLARTPELRRRIQDFLTLYWAEVAQEYAAGQRALAATRKSKYYDTSFWGSGTRIVYSYGWGGDGYVTGYNWIAKMAGSAIFGDYRIPEIVTAIARDRDRGAYLATSRRHGGLMETETFLRRDVYYTPDYTLSTMTYHPEEYYINTIKLAQRMGANLLGGGLILVQPHAGLAERGITGITGEAVSIIARDINAVYGRGGSQSTGTFVYFSKKEWDNRVEDPSGWLFTRGGNAFAAVRPATSISQKEREEANLLEGDIDKLTKAEDDKLPKAETKVTTHVIGCQVEPVGNHGYKLMLEDMWAPVVLQLGRAEDYDSFEAFQAAVRDNKFAYENELLTYQSEADDVYEYPSKSKNLPRINGREVTTEPEKTYNSPFLSMVYGEPTATISYPGYEDLVLDFGDKVRDKDPLIFRLNLSP